MADTIVPVSLERWLEAALAEASAEEVLDDDGSTAGWWAENARCAGASAFGPTRHEALRRLREVLVGWVELGHEMGHPIPAMGQSTTAAPA